MITSDLLVESSISMHLAPTFQTGRYSRMESNLILCLAESSSFDIGVYPSKSIGTLAEAPQHKATVRATQFLIARISRHIPCLGERLCSPKYSQDLIVAVQLRGCVGAFRPPKSEAESPSGISPPSPLNKDAGFCSALKTPSHPAPSCVFSLDTI